MRKVWFVKLRLYGSALVLFVWALCRVAFGIGVPAIFDVILGIAVIVQVREVIRCYRVLLRALEHDDVDPEDGCG